VMLYGVGGMVFAALSTLLVRRLGEPGLAAAGGITLCVCLAAIAVSRAGWLAALACLCAGLGFYMMHNTLQVHATQMAPDSRGAALALFAFCLFTGQSLGVWLASLMVDARGTVPLFLAAGAGLALLAFFFQRRLLARRVN